MENRFKLEEELLKKYKLVIGVDEVGRGPLAGPVISAAVFFESNLKSESWWEEIKDSKKASEKKREKLSKDILKSSLYGIGTGSISQIESFNILQSSLVSMRLAVVDLINKYKIINGSISDQDIYVLVDGNQKIPGLPFKQFAITKGDDSVHSIAAASIVAKVYRDNIMKNLDKQYPEYSFGANKGYGTLKHREAIKKYGLTKHHRKSFCKNLI